ncbi:MAG: hypothetical protein JNJ48_03760 [Phycisphaerae bacterium]|nr:hypothetical protein [Phycisphaerae bacterium]
MTKSAATRLLAVAALAGAGSAGGCAEMAAADAGLAAANLAIGGVYALGDAIHQVTTPQEPTAAQKVQRSRELLGRMAKGQTKLENLTESDRKLLASMAVVVNEKKRERRGED